MAKLADAADSKSLDEVNARSPLLAVYIWLPGSPRERSKNTEFTDANRSKPPGHNTIHQEIVTLCQTLMKVRV